MPLILYPPQMTIKSGQAWNSLKLLFIFIVSSRGHFKFTFDQFYEQAPLSIQNEALKFDLKYCLTFAKEVAAAFRMLKQKRLNAGGSPGLVVIGGDSCFKGRGFESQNHFLDGHFFTFIGCKNRLFENTKINEKETGDAPFF